MAIRKMKCEIPLGKLCSGLGENFTKFFEYINGLKFNDIPDYVFLRSLFESSSIRPIIKETQSEKFGQDCMSFLEPDMNTECDERYIIYTPYVGKYQDNKLSIIGDSKVRVKYDDRSENYDRYDSLYTFQK